MRTGNGSWMKGVADGLEVALLVSHDVNVGQHKFLQLAILHGAHQGLAGRADVDPHDTQARFGSKCSVVGELVLPAFARVLENGQLSSNSSRYKPLQWQPRTRQGIMVMWGLEGDRRRGVTAIPS